MLLCLRDRIEVQVGDPTDGTQPDVNLNPADTDRHIDRPIHYANPPPVGQPAEPHQK
jgi:hypothetical protein